MTNKKYVDLYNAVQKQYDLKKIAGEPVQEFSKLAFKNFIDMWVEDYEYDFGAESLNDESVEIIAQKVVQKMYITSSKYLKALTYSIMTQIDNVNWDEARDWASTYVFNQNSRNFGLTNEGFVEAIDKIEAFVKAKEDLENWFKYNPDAAKYYQLFLYHYLGKTFDGNSPTEVDEALTQLFQNYYFSVPAVPTDVVGS